jgi:crotonobetainyl-CoA:carnitine CoA-transferase CaiB-like acyl-CoA transferase
MSTFDALGRWTVVELASGFGAAALAGKFFADLGATVAKVEDERGDPLRADAPAFALVATPKHSVGVGRGRDGASAPLHALLAGADVLVADRAGLAMARRVLRVDDLGTAFPALTVCACTPFGLDGPLAGWTGGEEVVQAASGIMSVTGHADGVATRIAGTPLTQATAMLAVTAALADAFRKRRGERAAALDVAIHDTAIAFLSANLPAYFLNGSAPRPIGNRHSMAAPWNSFPCRDGWAIVCAGNHPTWLRLCEAIGRPDLLDDPRYATQEERVRHVDALEAEVAHWTRTRTVAEVEAAFNRETIPCGSVLPLAEVLASRQVAERGLVRSIDGATVAGGTFHLDREPLALRRGAPALGAGTHSMLARCGARADDIARWLADGSAFDAEGARHARAA